VTTSQTSVTQGEIDSEYNKLKTEGESGGYFLNPDIEFTKELVKGLLINERRYGYMACPCRLASADKVQDLDIICPCDYRDADVSEYGNCYCGLYVSQAVVNGEKSIGPIPERRQKDVARKKPASNIQKGLSALPLPVWRCRVCGYLCARDGPPELCPICKAKKERFERFI
jgi:ferredoxin-thioredoxin reductase catalytic subunit